MHRNQIEQIARELQREIWEKRDSLWEREPQYLRMFEPEIAARVLGVTYTVERELGRFGERGEKFEIAGMFDRTTNRISVSGRFSHEVVRFTGAHEIGHWVIHEHQNLHRDRPVAGLKTDSIRNPIETEADHFAACYLMPRGFVTSAYEEIFGDRKPFIFNSHSAAALCPQNPSSLLSANDPFVRGLALARYQPKSSFSLAESFRVSPTSMAIRLVELGLAA